MAEAQPNDEMVSQFLAVTGSADVPRAVQYLEMSGGNLETAVGLFMEHHPTSNQHEDAGVASMPSASAAAGASPQVRAPDETRSMRLMDGGGGGGGYINPLMGALMQAEQDEDLNVMASAFSRAVDPRAAVNAAANNQEEQQQEESKQHSEPGLDDLFAPPTNILFQGGFQEARAVAKDAKRWLLVNIQQNASFASHALNRDVWRNDLVENLVREGFIFFQTFDTTPEGRTYCERYQVHVFPHVSIIDARTGRLVWRKEGWTMETPFLAEDFAEMAMDVCSRHSLDKPPSAKKPKTTAIQQEETVVLYSSEEEDEEEDVEPSFLETLLTTKVAPEPATGGARIQIRMPDAKRLVRRFDSTDTLKSIYAFVAQSNDEAKGGKEFTLSAFYPPKDLMNDLEKSVQECGLDGEAITVRWK